MMRIRRSPTANQAGLFDDMPDMVAVTNATRFGEFKDALVDLWCLLIQALISKCSGNVLSFCARDHCEFSGERFLHLPGVGCRQLVFCHQPSLRPQRGFRSKEMAPDLEHLARMPWPVASLASSGIKAFNSDLDRSWSRKASRVLR